MKEFITGLIKYILEILNPETLKPVEDGEIGEMVVTTLCPRKLLPLIRYRTRDLTRKLTKTMFLRKSILPMHDKIMGRSDDMIILRGVNIYPGQIDEVLSSVLTKWTVNTSFILKEKMTAKII